MAWFLLACYGPATHLWAFRDVRLLRNKFVAAGFWLYVIYVILHAMIPNLCLFQRYGVALMFSVSGATSMLHPFDWQRRLQRILLFSAIAATISIFTLVYN